MTDRPNVLLITIDSLRLDAVGCLGAAGAGTAAIDALASRGVLFRQAIANGPRTPSSFPAILSSVYPILSGEQGVAENAVTWAEAMQAAGYRTAGFNLDNPYLSAQYGYGRGFELYEDFWIAERSAGAQRRGAWRRMKKSVQDWIGRRNLAFLLFFQGLLVRGAAPYARGPLATDKAIAWVAEPDRRPFFCWLHYMEVHYPYLPLGRAIGLHDRCRYLVAMLALLAGSYGYPVRALRAMYAERVRYVDALVGHLLAALRGLGLEQNTVVILTSDHGDMFHEHGAFAHRPMPYDELLRVPLVIAGPGLPGACTVGAQVDLLGLAPTALDLAGIPAPASFLGSSFLPLALGRGTGKECVFAGATHNGGRRSRHPTSGRYRILACRTPGWKYIFDDEGPVHELYDLRRDPGERTNVFGREREQASRMQELLRQHQCMLDQQSRRYRPRPGAGAKEDEAVRRRLAALGYL